MRRLFAVAIVALALTAAARADVTPYARWVQANPHHAIAPAQPLAAPRYDPKQLARTELSPAGRYDLSDRTVKPRQKTIWERFWEWVNGLWDRFWKATFGRVKIGREGSVAIGDVLIGLFALTVIGIAVRLLMLVQIDRRSPTSAVELGATRNAHALYLQAVARAQLGDYTDAVRLIFLAAVVALDLRGIVHDDPSATVGDLRRALREREPGKVSLFDRISAPFVRVAYAELPIDEADWNASLAGYRSLVSAETA